MIQTLTPCRIFFANWNWLAGPSPFKRSPLPTAHG
jgi:hypothetical protein